MRELAKVCSPGRSEAIILVEAALAVMRLSCEKLFVLAAVFVAYLLFRDDVPGYARVLIRMNHRISSLFQRVPAPSPCAHCPPLSAGPLLLQSAHLALLLLRAGPQALHDTHFRSWNQVEGLRACQRWRPLG